MHGNRLTAVGLQTQTQAPPTVTHTGTNHGEGSSVFAFLPLVLVLFIILLWKLPTIRRIWGSVATEINTPKTTEIDITRQSRALGVLRLVEHWLAIQLGFSAIMDILRILLFNSAVEVLPIATLFGWSAYVFFRHSGEMNLKAWKLYLVLFPVLFFVSIGVLASLWMQVTRLGFDEGITVAGLGFLTLAILTALGFGCVLSLIRTPISQLSITTSQLIAKLNDQTLGEVPPQSSLRSINFKWGVIFAASAALLLGGALFLVVQSDDLVARGNASLWLLFPGYLCAQRARRYFHFNAESLLSIDKRRPVLFLRSFGDDETQTSQNPSDALLDYSLELRIAKHFFRFGPFIAIGSPSDTVPQLGAARATLSDDKWQQAVLNWINSASLVVMYLGKTSWVTWELERIIRNGRLHDLIIVMPEVRIWSSTKRFEELAQRAARLRLVFGGTVWADQLTAFWDYISLRALVFRDDGSIVVIKSGARNRDSYHLAAVIAHFMRSESLCDATGQ